MGNSGCAQARSYVAMLWDRPSHGDPGLEGLGGGGPTWELAGCGGGGSRGVHLACWLAIKIFLSPSESV
jgi:hypothetical protein